MRHAVRGFLKTRKGSNSHRPVRGPGKTRTSFEIAGILTQRTPLSGGKDDDFHFSKSFSLQPGIGYIALESSRRLGRQVPIFCAVTWGAASINQWWPWPRKNVVMCYDGQLDYADLLADMDSWGEEPPADKVSELTMRVFRRMNEVMEEIRGERMPSEGYWDYRNMRRQAW